jgi:hypothetical protein
MTRGYDSPEKVACREEIGQHLVIFGSQGEYLFYARGRSLKFTTQAVIVDSARHYD